MNIDTLRITHFGPFHQKEISLSSGINVIYGENEAGKTTVYQFIQAMLFGVERLRGKASKRDEYSRFQPWEQGKNYEGSMIIEHNGEKYRLVRNFYKEDEYFKVEQMNTGKEILLPSHQIDSLIPGMSRGNFKNALSIGQMGSVVDARFGLTLQAYMANVKRTKSQEVDILRTLDYLKKERKVQKDKSLENKLEELETQIEELKIQVKGKTALAQTICQKRESLEALRNQQQKERSEGRENRKREQKERMEAIRLIEENNYIASEYRQKKAVYEDLKKQTIQEDFDAVKARWDEANEAYDELSDTYGQLMGRNLAIMFSVMMFGLIPVIGVFFLKSPMVVRIGVTGLLIVVLALTWMVLQAGRKRMAKKLGESKRHMDEIHDDMEQHMFGRGNRNTLNQLKSEMQELRARYEALQEPLRPYIEKYGEDISLDTDEAEAEESLEKLRVQEENLTRSLERLLVEKEELDRKIAELAELENEKEELANEACDEREKIGIIDECIEIIQSLSEEIHSDFGPSLNAEVSTMIWEMSGGKYERVVVDNELNLKVDTGNRFVEAGQLSSGTQEQLYLALRLAMVKLLFPKGTMPVLFDDSFVFYDDKRLARTLAWLSRQKFSQVIIFTCQHREMDILERLGIEYTPIYLS